MWPGQFSLLGLWGTCVFDPAPSSQNFQHLRPLIVKNRVQKFSHSQCGSELGRINEWLKLACMESLSATEGSQSVPFLDGGGCLPGLDVQGEDCGFWLIPLSLALSGRLNWQNTGNGWTHVSSPCRFPSQGHLPIYPPRKRGKHTAVSPTALVALCQKDYELLNRPGL